MNAIIEIHYLPSIRYFSKFYRYDHILIDDQEPFIKQSYRNRCSIGAANGKTDLIIPVHSSRKSIPVRDISIDNHSSWQRQHWHSIRSAYGKTPFFEHYAYKLENLFVKKPDSLFDFNMEAINTLMGILKIEPGKLRLLSENMNLPIAVKDLRHSIHPKERLNKKDPDFDLIHYFQAFQVKNGFIPNMSVIDLIFNMGPEAVKILQQDFS